jgi:hypothetical protein
MASYQRRIRQENRVVDLLDRAVVHAHAVDHARIGRDDVAVVFAAQPLLHDLHVQQAQETAAEAEAQRHARLGLVLERAVVQRQLLQRIFQLFVVGSASIG